MGAVSNGVAMVGAGASELTLSGISLMITQLAIDSAMDSYNGAVQSNELKRQAIQQGLWSQVAKQADAQATRAAKSAETWNQM